MLNGSLKNSCYAAEGYIRRAFFLGTPGQSPNRSLGIQRSTTPENGGEPGKVDITLALAPTGAWSAKARGRTWIHQDDGDYGNGTGPSSRRVLLNLF